jgi:hypothetical protein
MVRNALAALIAVVAVGGTGLAWLEYASSHDPRYASVVSISRTRDFQDPAVLERGWALPVAAAYRHGGYEYQANPSFFLRASERSQCPALRRSERHATVRAEWQRHPSHFRPITDGDHP